MWTQNQKKAIDAPCGNLLVTAAAGSGKTAVMVERIIKRILDKNGTDIDRLLVVTYTNAAASEIKERIQLGIIKKLDENPDDARLQKQLLLIDNAKICTIHSLCLDIIKQYFYKLDIDASFRIGDVLEVQRLKSDSLEEVFEEYYNSDDKDFLSLVDSFCAGSKTDSKLTDIVSQIYEFSMSVPNPEKWLEMCCEIYQNRNFKSHTDCLLKKIKNRLSLALMICDNSIAICKKSDENGCMPLLLKDRDIIYDLIDNVSDIDSIYDACSAVKFPVFSKSYKSELSDFVVQRVEENRKIIKDTIKDVISKITVKESDFDEDCLHIYHQVSKLCEIVQCFFRRFAEAKKERGIIDFSDFEHFALKILQDGDGVRSEEARELSEKFDEIYVDEYQDCNPIQDRIFWLISGCDDKRPNIFMVGDVKQSIYKFRDAAPMLFKEKMLSYPDFDGEKPYSKISLSKNFRSRKEILNGTNYIFSQIMSDYVGEIEYNDYLVENENEEYETTPKCFSDIEVAVIDSENLSIGIDEQESEESSEEYENIESEAAYIGNKIRELVDSKVMIYDKSIKQKRCISYRDIVVLMRSTRGRTEVFDDIFKSLEIPVFSDAGASYFTSSEISVILSYLKIIVNPIDDINLAVVLRSGVFKFTDDELMKIRLGLKNDFFYYALINYCDTHSDELSVKIKSFLEKTDELKAMSKYLPTDEFIWKVLEKTDYLTYLGTLPLAEQKKLNIRMLINKAAQFESTDFKGIYNFTKFVDDIVSRNSDTDAAKVVSESDDVVRIMSIHKSKGLEFPVVFLSQCGKKFNFADETKAVLCHKEYGIGINFIDYEKRFSYTPIVKNAIKEKIHLETLSEEERILYVAMTRAKEKLYITGVLNNAGNVMNKLHIYLSLTDSKSLPQTMTETAVSYFDWILPALYRHPDCIELRDNFGYVKTADSLKSRFLVKIVPKSICTVLREKYEKQYDFNIDSTVCHSDMHDEIFSRLSYKYDCDFDEIPSNVTVTEIKKIFEENNGGYKYFHSNKVSKPKFAAKTNAAMLGTIVHKILQYIDFKSVTGYNEFESEIDRLKKNGDVSESEINLIDLKPVYEFIVSEIGRRISKSDRICRETPFKIEENASDVFAGVNGDEKIIIQGAIDLFFFDDSGIVLVDYKTDKLSCEEIAEKYLIQLKFYKKAVEKITGLCVSECYIYSFYNNSDIRIEV